MDRLAREFAVAGRGPSHVGERRLPPDNLGHQFLDKSVIGHEQGVLLGIFIECVDAPRHGVPRRVIAAYDQKKQVAQVICCAHMFGRLSVDEHRNEVVPLWAISPILPKSGEVRNALHHLVALLGLGFDNAAGLRNGENNVGPAR